MLKEIKKLMHNAIRDTEFEHNAYFAGGCVRDELLGRQTNDIDITVELPDGGIRLAQLLYEQGLTSKPVIYKQFGTALIIWIDYKIELVMTRRESYRAKSRKPDVAFGTLQEDVMRRDFTLNSLLMRISDGEILDLCGMGIADLNAKIIRATSEAEVMFKEDPLRIMRAVRFATTLGFSIDKSTLCVLKKIVPELKHISKERIAEEFIKIIYCSEFLQGLRLLKTTGILPVILPKLRIPSQLLSQNSDNTQYHLESTNLISKLTLIFWRHADPTPFLKMLKLSGKEIQSINRITDICKTIRYLQKDRLELSLVQTRRIAFWYRDVLEDIVKTFPLTCMFLNPETARFEKDNELCIKLSNEASLLDMKRFSLTGEDLMRTFCSENGSWVGEMLMQAREYWFEHPDAGREELLQALKSRYQKR